MKNEKKDTWTTVMLLTRKISREETVLQMVEVWESLREKAESTVVAAQDQEGEIESKRYRTRKQWTI
jgi:hypothetical protein